MSKVYGVQQQLCSNLSTSWGHPCTAACCRCAAASGHTSKSPPSALSSFCKFVKTPSAICHSPPKHTLPPIPFSQQLYTATVCHSRYGVSVLQQQSLSFSVGSVYTMESPFRSSWQQHQSYSSVCRIHTVSHTTGIKYYH